MKTGRIDFKDKRSYRCECGATVKLPYRSRMTLEQLEINHNKSCTARKES